MLGRDRLRTMGMELTDKGDHLDDDGVIVVLETGKGTGDRRLATEFLAQLPDDRSLWRLARLDLAAGKFPFEWEVFVGGALRHEHTTVALDQGTDDENGIPV